MPLSSNLFVELIWVDSKIVAEWITPLKGFMVPHTSFFQCKSRDLIVFNKFFSRINSNSIVSFKSFIFTSNTIHFSLHC